MPRLPRRPSVLAVGLAGALSFLPASDAWASGVRGSYDSPLGRLLVVEKDGVVTARTAEAGGPCGFPKGKVVLEGTRLDDNVTGSITACKVGAGCKGPAPGMVMLLITRSGAVMSGAAHLEAGSCKTPLAGDGITLKRTSSTKATRESTKGRDGKRKPEGRAVDGKRDAKANEKADGTRDDKRDEMRDEPRMRRARAEALATEGARLMETGAIEEARAKFLESTRVDPSYSQGFVGVGVTYYMRDRYDEALDFYKQGLEANPGNRDAYYNTACVYALKGDTAQALRYLQIAVLNGYVQLDTLERDPDLKSLHGNPDFERLKSGQL